MSRVYTSGVRFGLSNSLATGIGVKNCIEPDDRFPIILPATTDITYVGWKIWDCDQFVIQPGEIGQVAQLEDTGLTLDA